MKRKHAFSIFQENPHMKLSTMSRAVLLLFLGFVLTAGAAEKSKKAWIGVMVQNVTEELAKKHKLNTASGAYVTEVVDASPADSAGFQEGDVILEFNGKKIADAQALVKAVVAAEIGKAVPVLIVRDGEHKTLTVVPSAGAKQLRVTARAFAVPGGSGTIRIPSLPAVPAVPSLSGLFQCSEGGCCGMTLRALNEQLGNYFGAPNGKGVLVEEVKSESKAAAAGFKAGDVIVKAGKKTVTKVADFRAAFGAYDEGEKIPVEVLRKGQSTVLTLEVAEQDEDCGMMMFRGDCGDENMIFRSMPDCGDENGTMDIRIETDGDEKGEGDEAVREYRIQVDKSGKQQQKSGVKKKIRIERRIESDNI
jgi:S1-C subfamily serine protease